MKKIVIFYGLYGGGHLSAAKSIKQYIENNYPSITVDMIDFMEYINKVLNKLTTKAYSDMATNARWVWSKVYTSSEDGAIGKFNNSVQKMLSIKLHYLIDELDPDLIISTHPFSSQMCALLKKKKKINCRIATVLTDYAPHKQWLMYPAYIDYFFVAHDGMKLALMSKNIKETQIRVTGIPVSNRFLDNYDKPLLYSQYGLSEDKNTILFFAGGGQGFGKDYTLNLFKTLVGNYSNYQLIAIAGKNEKMKKQFDEIVEEYDASNNVKVLGYTNQVPELMSISDIAVTKPGGLTTTECLVSGLPIIIIDPIPGQEEANAKFQEQNGVGFWLKKDGHIEENLNGILNSEEIIQKMKGQALLLAKKNSTKDICETLLENKHTSYY